MTRRELALLHQGQYRGREIENPEKTGDGGAVFSDGIGHLLLGQTEVIDKGAVARCFFDGVEVRSLQILDHGQREQHTIVDVFDDCGHFGPAQAGDGAKATLAGDQLEAIASFAHRDGLKEAGCADGRLQFAELALIEFMSGLKLVGPDQRDLDPPELV